VQAIPQPQAAVALPVPAATTAPVVVPAVELQQVQVPVNGHSVQQSMPQTATPAIQAPVVTMPQPATSVPPVSAAPAVGPDLANALSALIPGNVTTDPVKLAYYVQVMQQLATLGVPPAQWGQVLQALAASQAVPAAQVPTPVATSQPAVQMQAQTLPMPSAQYTQPVAQVSQTAPIVSQVIPHNQIQPLQTQLAGQNPATQTQARRSRSRSPTRGRGSPVYDTYQDGNNDLRQNFRQRSPLRGTSTLQADMISLNDPSDVAGTDGSKWTEMDYELANRGHIKVLSRTLFVGGVSCSDEELRQIFSRFGQVQSAIVNMDKRHAFVKMCNRADAVAARDGMEDVQDPDVASRVRKVCLRRYWSSETLLTCFRFGGASDLALANATTTTLV
jgi:protein NRD1